MPKIMKNERSAGVIVFSNDQSDLSFLLLKHKDGHWGFPKGHMNPGEDEIDCAIRELSEETGISRKELEFEPGFQRMVDYSYRRNNEDVHEDTTYLLGAVPNPSNITLSNEEHTTFAWANIQEGLTLLQHENLRWVLKSAEKFLKDEQPRIKSSTH